jgi:hypothetical protein
MWKYQLMAPFDLPLPRKTWPFWCLTALAVTGFPTTSFFYFDALLRSRALPPNGDSVSIPMFSSVILAVLAAPVAILVTFLSIWRYQPGGTLLSWRPKQWLFSGIITVLFGAPFLFFTYTLIQIVMIRQPVIGYIWAPYTAVLAAWFLFLRAAAVTRRI